MIIRLISVVVLAGALAACQSDGPGVPMSAMNPALSPVGSGLYVERQPLPAAFTEPDEKSTNSLWGRRNQGLFHDLRAHKVGDVITVTIDINDKAQFDNTSGRTKEGSLKGLFGGKLGWDLDSTKAGSIGGEASASAAASASGKGSIDRSEKLHLTIAAVVTEVLPDGNVLISGSQEVRVNHEVRVLNIAGIVRPLDIGNDNTIPYTKIAEARISYGGRGKISAVQ